MVGAFLGLLHLLWSVLVATGVAQVLMDFVFSLHFLNNPFTVSAFDWVKALGLVLLTFVIGYCFGWFLTMLWNSLHKHQ